MEENMSEVISDLQQVFTVQPFGLEQFQKVARMTEQGEVRLEDGVKMRPVLRKHLPTKRQDAQSIFARLETIADKLTDPLLKSRLFWEIAGAARESGLRDLAKSINCKSRKVRESKHGGTILDKIDQSLRLVQMDQQAFLRELLDARKEIRKSRQDSPGLSRNKANTVLARLSEAAEKHRDPVVRSKEYLQAARSKIEFSEYLEAIEVLETINEPYLRVWVIARVVFHSAWEGLETTSITERLLSFSKDIPVEFERDLAYFEIAVTLAMIGKDEKAFEAVDKIVHKELQEVAQFRVAVEMARLIYKVYISMS